MRTFVALIVLPVPKCVCVRRGIQCSARGCGDRNAASASILLCSVASAVQYVAAKLRSPLGASHMRSMFCFLNVAAASAAVCIALSSANLNAQETPKPDTHGIVVANMDRSVTPGDNFY